MKVIQVHIAAIIVGTVRQGNVDRRGNFDRLGSFAKSATVPSQECLFVASAFMEINE